MKKIFTISFLLLSLLVARDNPFQEVVIQGNIHIDNKFIEEPKYFKKSKIYLPDTSRIIKNVIIEYQNLDGTISKHKKRVNRAVDWHYPLILTQQKRNEKIQFKDKTKTKLYKCKIERPKQAIKAFQFSVINMCEKKMLIATKDELIREFYLPNPARIVLDFARERGARTKVIKNLQVIPFNKIVIGKHNSYYRMVIYMDGKYKYRLSDHKDGYLIDVK